MFTLEKWFSILFYFFFFRQTETVLQRPALKICTMGMRSIIYCITQPASRNFYQQKCFQYALLKTVFNDFLLSTWKKSELFFWIYFLKLIFAQKNQTILIFLNLNQITFQLWKIERILLFHTKICRFQRKIYFSG